ncbi:MAG: hypothetical protein VYA34_10925 [Myxococcota bacterium]|nr:hypothetical protein [Myxococcota bacterium]
MRFPIHVDWDFEDMDEFSDDEGIDVEFEPDLLDEVGISKIFSFVFDWLHI